MFQEEPEYVEGEVTLQYPKMQALEVATAAVVVAVPVVDATDDMVVDAAAVDDTAVDDTAVDDTAVDVTDEALLLELEEQADTTNTNGNAAARGSHRYARAPETGNVMFPSVYHQRDQSGAHGTEKRQRALGSDD
jgi:hypothetical protein